MPDVLHGMHMPNEFVFFISVRFVPDKLPETDELIKYKGLAKDYLYIKKSVGVCTVTRSAFRGLRIAHHC